VFSIAQYLQVLNSVVHSVSIDMVDMLPSFKLSSKMKLHNVTMFSDCFAINNYRFVFPWSAFSSASNNRTGELGLFGYLWMGQCDAAARAIQCGLEPIFRRIKRFATNFAFQRFSVSAFKAALFAKPFGEIKRLTTPTAILVAGASWFKFVFAMRTFFKFHTGHHSYCGV
jgi:hypothetical protein